MYPHLQKYIVVTDKSTTAYKKILRDSTQKRVEIMQLLDDSHLHPVSTVQSNASPHTLPLQTSSI